MRIGVISDTHGNTGYMERVCAFLTQIHKIDRIFHLGDSYKDGLRMCDSMSVEGVTVPGIYCEEYKGSETANVVVEECLDRFDRLLFEDKLKEEAR